MQHTDTVDDIDEDEAFINELIALHPNDEDIIVEDIEATDYNMPTTTLAALTPSIEASIIDRETINDNNVNADENDNNNEGHDDDDGVRK